ncbi:hypothetical protein EYF80_048578 [Liparis tanakae]|uniref:Uncharacterized protein n=1 Tax=Liparis tanakae TaxID=230148 RepID=A0A4Z2FK42_9TELE|nr:hypothetical protein EYF80_048578 [Liparis tanakae]
MGEGRRRERRLAIGRKRTRPRVRMSMERVHIDDVTGHVHIDDVTAHVHIDDVTWWLVSPSGMGLSSGGGCFTSDTATSRYPASSSSSADMQTQRGTSIQTEVFFLLDMRPAWGPWRGGEEGGVVGGVVGEVVGKVVGKVVGGVVAGVEAGLHLPHVRRFI